MIESFLAECGPLKHHVEANQNSLDKIKDELPEDILGLLSAGMGSYMNGYFWTVDPFDYQSILDEVYTPVELPSTCFARDAFAGLYLWEGGSIIYINVRHGNSKVVGRKTSVFFNHIITDWEYMSDLLGLENYFPAKAALGDLSAEQCYGYVPIPGLGGAEKVENLQIVKTKEHLSIIAQVMGKIR
ncbi:T6SS immunity protein Tdi1 domain-containing protein [Pedobacter caeni]|uniref:DUF1851 domain-containing protein n=1 Tax=Pedobacter caeni TaxID=288992 RepID=A0A1M4VEV3_9SPHI|nr:T6SS immunity protein Tdi1 domain-containing protein [Pedobacter caeni]SHE67516.1 hypothetical protein SAMN04488522_101887 [Pedobacter caeni]